MKKLLPIIIAIVVLGAGAALLLTKSGGEGSDAQTAKPSTVGTETNVFSSKKACDILTLEDAKKILGDNAELTELPGGGGATSDDIEVSQCVYSQPGGDTLASIKAQKQASILVRGAKTQDGADSNKEVFTGSLKPAGVQEVTGYGDGAFWNPQLGQFNILKNGNWYILTSGGSMPAEKTLDDAKTFASLLASKL